MKRSTLSVAIGAALLLVGSTAVLAAGRSGAEQGDTATSALFTPASVALVPPTCDNSPDGAACSANGDCSSKKCEGGSCCTKHEDPCDSSSHCCGHQSCGTDGKCP